MTFPPFFEETGYVSWSAATRSHPTSHHHQERKQQATVNISEQLMSKKKKSTCYIKTLFGCLNKHVLPWSTMLPDNPRAGGQRPYCTWGLWGLGAGSEQAQSCSWLPLLLAALMLWQQGKQNSFWQTGRMQQGQMRHLWTVWEWMLSADHELTFLGEK